MSDTVKLRDVASIEISNVDKKTKINEKNVKLCNFVDVYRNWSITKYLSKDFMNASASDTQIERLKVKKGQVAITKDSETRDDIGISTYIEDSLENTVLGYHCVLITPNEGVLSGCYLNAYLHSAMAKKYFENNASGSGQRYTLTNDIVENIPIMLPNITKQEKLGEIFTLINQKMENNTIINNELESIAKIIYDYWFVQFDFPDENGRPYKSSGGKMVWNEELKREIPEGWKFDSIKSLIDKNKSGNWGNEKKIECSDIAVNCFRGADFESVIKNPVFTAPIRYVNEKNRVNFLEDGDFIVEISGGSPTQSTGRIAYVNKEFLERTLYPVNCSNFCRAFSLNKKIYQYWFLQLWNILYDNRLMFNYESKTTGIKNLMLEELFTGFKVAIPPEEIAQKYQSVVKNFYTEIQKNLKESKELVDLRDFLLPMLMNGQVTIKDQD